MARIRKSEIFCQTAHFSRRNSFIQRPSCSKLASSALLITMLLLLKMFQNPAQLPFIFPITLTDETALISLRCDDCVGPKNLQKEFPVGQYPILRLLIFHGSWIQVLLSLVLRNISLHSIAGLKPSWAVSNYGFFCCGVVRFCFNLNVLGCNLYFLWHLSYPVILSVYIPVIPDSTFYHMYDTG